MRGESVHDSGDRGTWIASSKAITRLGDRWTKHQLTRVFLLRKFLMELIN